MNKIKIFRGYPFRHKNCVKIVSWEFYNMMYMKLNIKKPCEFFWLRKIVGVDITQCCMKCFIGENDNKVYHASRNAPTIIETEIPEEITFTPPLAYYLCGLSKNFEYAKNTHIAFNPCDDGVIEIDNAEINLIITGAKQIDFAGYKPNPPGFFTEKQRTCRNWIFANYIKDGQPL